MADIFVRGFRANRPVSSDNPGDDPTGVCRGHEDDVVIDMSGGPWVVFERELQHVGQRRTLVLLWGRVPAPPLHRGQTCRGSADFRMSSR